MIKFCKIKLFGVLLALFSFLTLSSNVSASTITVHYNNSDANRLPTYTAIQSYMGSTHSVNGYNNGGNSSALNQLKNSVFFVAHHHGDPGRQYLNGSSNGISGTNGDGTTWKAISSMSTQVSKPLYMAIYYGCQTGKTNTSYGNIMSQTTSKVGKSAIAWTIDTYVNDVNLWNKYFFQKGAVSTSTGAAALTYADTSLAADSGAIAALDMKNNRVSSGYYTWTFSQTLYS